MNISIRNYRGVREAAIDLSRIALVAGPNASGKSSIAAAVQSALTGATTGDLRKGDSGMLLHSGASKGSVTVTTEQGEIVIDYPRAVLATTGTPPAASVYAVGLTSIADLDHKARATVLISYLKALPDADHIDRALVAIGLDSVQRASLAAKIAELSWDGAHAHAKEVGIKLKGKWETLTGERYGSSKGDSWMPAHWEPDLASASDESLQAAVTQAREFVEAAIGTTAVSDAERDQLAKAAAMVGELILKQGTKQTALASASAMLTKAADAAASLPKPKGLEVVEPCPHCGLGVVLRGGKLLKPTADDDEETQGKRRAALGLADAVVAEASQALRIARDELAEVDLNLKRAKAATDRLKVLGPQLEAAADLERAREGATLAERRLLAFTVKRDADRTHGNVLKNLAVQAMLAPDGLRLTCLRQAVRTFNTQMLALSRTASWADVVLDDDLSISYGGRTFALCSESEQFRVRVVLQIAMAGEDDSEVLVIDGADILDSAGRNGLFRVLAGLSWPTLVCMTLPADKVPVLGALGRSYWMDGAVAVKRQAVTA